MLDFIARRLVAIIPVLAVVAVFVFLMLRLTPGDPAAVIAGDNATSDQIAMIREKLGLTLPIWEQFGIWIADILRGNFGESFFFKKTVAELIAQRIEPTLALSICTLIFAVSVAVPQMQLSVDDFRDKALIAVRRAAKEIARVVQASGTISAAV